jgi:hypothetical protein
MDVTAGERNLPGQPAGTPPKLLVAIGAVFAMISAGFEAYLASVEGQVGGHHPWPIVQWAVATPLGALTVVMLAALAAGFPLALVQPLLFARQIATAADVTGLPVETWPTPMPRQPMGTAGDRYFGRDRCSAGIYT